LGFGPSFNLQSVEGYVVDVAVPVQSTVKDTFDLLIVQSTGGGDAERTSFTAEEQVFAVGTDGRRGFIRERVDIMFEVLGLVPVTVLAKAGIEIAARVSDPTPFNGFGAVGAFRQFASG
jgi:hypothetical protein